MNYLMSEKAKSLFELLGLLRAIKQELKKTASMLLVEAKARKAKVKGKDKASPSLKPQSSIPLIHNSLVM